MAGGRGNVLHHIKGRGIVREGECPEDISPGEYVQGNVRIPGAHTLYIYTFVCSERLNVK